MDKEKYAINVWDICKEGTTWGRLDVDVWLCLLILRKLAGCRCVGCIQLSHSTIKLRAFVKTVMILCEVQGIS